MAVILIGIALWCCHPSLKARVLDSGVFLGKQSEELLFLLAVDLSPMASRSSVASQSSCSPCREDPDLGGAESAAGAAVQRLLGFRVPHYPRLQRHDLWHLWCGSQSGNGPEERRKCAGTEECGSKYILAAFRTIFTPWQPPSCKLSQDQTAPVLPRRGEGLFYLRTAGGNLRRLLLIQHMYST